MDVDPPVELRERGAILSAIGRQASVFRLDAASSTARPADRRRHGQVNATVRMGRKYHHTRSFQCRYHDIMAAAAIFYNPVVAVRAGILKLFRL